jgi:hypothetical protein
MLFFPLPLARRTSALLGTMKAGDWIRVRARGIEGKKFPPFTSLIISIHIYPFGYMHPMKEVKDYLPDVFHFSSFKSIGSEVIGIEILRPNLPGITVAN